MTYGTHLRDLIVDTRTHTQPRLAYGHETEVPAMKSKIPSVDDLLKSLRAPAAQSCISNDEISPNSENKLLISQEFQSAKGENTNNNAPLSVMFNRRCSLSDTEILNRQLSNERLWSTNKPLRTGSPCKISSPRRIGSPHRIGSPRRSGSCDNFNFRALRKGSVAEEVLKELQCDSSLVQSSLDNNADLSDSLNISGTTLNDSLERPICVEGNAVGAWVDSYHGNQDTNHHVIDVDNSVLSVVSASKSSSQVVQEVFERPSILKASRFGMNRDSYSESFHGSSNKVVKKVRFQDQPSTIEYITKQPSYLSQVPTFQTPISRAMPYKSHYSKNHSETVVSHHYNSNSSTLSPKHESTSTLSTPVATKSSVCDSGELEKSHSIPTKTPTDEDINNLWSEIRSYFRDNTAKSQNGLKLISVENPGYLTQGTDRLLSTTQRGTIRTNPVTLLSRNKQATGTSNRMDYSEQVHKKDSRHCVSPVQITFNNSLLHTKEMKASGMFIDYIQIYIFMLSTSI